MVVAHEWSLRCKTALDLAVPWSEGMRLPTTAARATAATSESAFQAESSAETNQRQPRNPKIDNPTARKTADQARDVRQG
jgi:hypothetical protein